MNREAPDLVHRILQQARLGAPNSYCSRLSDRCAVSGENVCAAMRSGFESLVRCIAKPTTAETLFLVFSCSLSRETELFRDRSSLSEQESESAAFGAEERPEQFPAAPLESLHLKLFDQVVVGRAAFKADAGK